MQRVIAEIEENTLSSPALSEDSGLGPEEYDFRCTGSRKTESIAEVQPETEQKDQASSGTGFFVSKMGHIVTNQHVVDGCKRLTVGDNPSLRIPVHVIGVDTRNDLALLKPSTSNNGSDAYNSLFEKLNNSSMPLASTGLMRIDDIELGEGVLASGYPYGNTFGNTLKVTSGIVSAVRGIGDDTGQFQLDAAIQPGNSGGPIYDVNGNIVGVAVSQLNKFLVVEITGSLPENVNFAIKASTVRRFLTSNGLATEWSSLFNSMSTKKLAKIAQAQTVMVMCN